MNQVLASISRTLDDAYKVLGTVDITNLDRAQLEMHNRDLDTLRKIQAVLDASGRNRSHMQELAAIEQILKITEDYPI
jgi:hypothetical protein